MMRKLTCFVFLLAPAVLAQSDIPPKLDPVIDTQTKITAEVHQLGAWTISVGPSGGAAVFTANAASTSANGGKITFDVPAGQKLEAGWIVTLRPPMGVAVAMTTSAVVTKPSVRITVNPVYEGDDVITGRVTGTANAVRVEVAAPTGVTVNSDEASITGGTFTAGLTRRVPEGYTIRVKALQNGQEVGSLDYTAVVPVTYNWGRVRAYFSAGVTVAAADKVRTLDDGSKRYSRGFDSADYFVGLNLDYNWMSNLKDQPATPCETPASFAEDLAILERIAGDWDGGDFDRWFERQKYLPQAAEQIASVLSNLSTTLTHLSNSVTGTGCLSTDGLRVGILTSLLPTVQDDITHLQDEAKRFRNTEKALDDLVRGYNASTNAALVALAIQDLTYAEYKAELEKLPAGVATREIAFVNTILAAERQITFGLEYAERDFSNLQDSMEEYRRSDPRAPTGGLLLNTSFESRLGQAPSVGDSASGRAASVIQNANTGYLGTEIYLPWWSSSMAWQYQNRENALFLAPIVKAGFLAGSLDEVTDPDRVFRHVFPHIAVGARLGHFSLSNKRKTVAPELVSFLDITYGRFDNFRQVGFEATNSTLPTTRDRIAKRIEVHGRFKIPETPLYVGFTGNFGPGVDDMRVFFGTRFDFSKAMGQLLGARR